MCCRCLGPLESTSAALPVLCFSRSGEGPQRDFPGRDLSDMSGPHVLRLILLNVPATFGENQCSLFRGMRYQTHSLGLQFVHIDRVLGDSVCGPLCFCMSQEQRHGSPLVWIVFVCGMRNPGRWSWGLPPERNVLTVRHNRLGVPQLGRAGGCWLLCITLSGSENHCLDDARGLTATLAE